MKEKELVFGFSCHEAVPSHSPVQGNLPETRDQNEMNQEQRNAPSQQPPNPALQSFLETVVAFTMI